LAADKFGMNENDNETFDERLSQWVSSQGFWFQVRYSMSGKGMRGKLMFLLVNLGFKFSIFLLIAVIFGWIYLEGRTRSASFLTGFKESLTEGFSATEVEIRGLQRLQGQMELSRFAAEGDNRTFFSALEARNIRCKMGLLDGLVGVWRPGIIAIAKLDVDLRAGADDAESAALMSKVFFSDPEKVEIRSFDISEANIRWGYSERTQGSIEATTIKMQRVNNSWRMILKGGFLSQNWLNRVEVIEMVVLCTPEEIIFEKADLKQGAGTIDLAGLRIKTGESPKVDGVAKIRSMPIENLVPVSVRNYLDGTISGDFRVFGSTNSSAGIGFEGQVLMDGTDLISLRERVHLLKALSVVDYSRNYHRVDFREGSCQLRVLGGGIELSEVNLKAEDLFTLEGALKVRLPTQKEIDDAIAKGDEFFGSALSDSADDAFQSEASAQNAGADITLKRAALVSEKDSSRDEGLSIFDRLSSNYELRRLQQQASERMSRMLRYEGSFRITIPADAFERAPRLQLEYPLDASIGRVPIMVPVQGNLHEVTLKQAEDIYEWRNK
jgi:hypothetical protein